MGMHPGGTFRGKVVTFYTWLFAQMTGLQRLHAEQLLIVAGGQAQNYIFQTL